MHKNDTFWMRTKRRRRFRLWWMRRFELRRMSATIEQLKKDYREQHPD